MFERIVPGLIAVVTLSLSSIAQAQQFDDRINALSNEIESAVIEWRHDIHQHPELSNREVRTAAKVEAHLKSLGFDEIYTGIAHTGVVGILRGGKPGPMVALRADMDALPVQEKTGLAFASKAIGEYNGQQVPVMHACGHDAHVAMLMGAAQVLASIKKDIPGSVKFVFQPAEEGPPAGEEGGASLMIKEDVLTIGGKAEAIFGIHVWPGKSGDLIYRSGGFLAAADGFEITITGSQTHGAVPWAGVDPIVVAAQIVNAIQTIPSRQLDITKAPSVLSVGTIHGGLRGNIIPEEVNMTGTIRNFDSGIREQLIEKLERTVIAIAESAGAKATLTVDPYAPVTYNDPSLLKNMLPTLQRVGQNGAMEGPLVTGAEDFAFFQKEIPGLYVALGVNMPGVGTTEAAPNHSPYFIVNDDALKTGVRAHSALALDYLTMKKQ